MAAERIRSRLSTAALAGIGVLALATAVLVLASIAQPAAPGLGIEARYYSNLVGAFVAWVWMLAGLFLQAVSERKNDPVAAGGMFAVGVGLLLVFNGVLIHDDASAIALRVVGYLVLCSLAPTAAAYYHYVPRETRERIRDPDHAPRS